MKQVAGHTKKEIVIRLLLGLLFGLVLIWGLLPLASSVENVGVVASAAVGLLGLAACIGWPVVWKTLKRMWGRRGLRWLLIVLIAAAALLAVLFIVVSGFMVAGAARPAPDNATVIVLGAAAYGNRPSRMLADRLDAAARYLEENPGSSCIVSGGQGPDETQTEASVMKAYLMEKGIDGARIYEEDTSTSTFENIRSSLALIEEHQLSRTVVLATQEFHQYRAQSFAEKAGLEGAGACVCRTPPHLFLCYWVREFAAICRMWLLGY